MTRARRSTDLLAAGVFLGYHAVVHGRWSRGGRLAANLAAAGTAVGAGNAVGLTLDEMGLSAGTARRGLAYGTGVAALVSGGIALAATMPRSRPLFADARAAALSRRDAAFELAVRIPLETALAEEVIFRGVHLGLTRRSHPPALAAIRTSLAFGLWHVPPALASLRRNPVGTAFTHSSARRAVAVAATVGATALAGMAFAELRVRSGSVLAPVIVHAAINATAFACAVMTLRDDANRAASRDLETSTRGAT
jgi:membrane protease YdiL (CAAX protease family)